MKFTANEILLEIKKMEIRLSAFKKYLKDNRHQFDIPLGDMNNYLKVIDELFATYDNVTVPIAREALGRDYLMIMKSAGYSAEPTWCPDLKRSIRVYKKMF